MKIDQIIVARETREGERRVALTPTAVASLITKHHCIMIESEAGILAGFKDEEYIQAGAHIFQLNSAGFPPHSLLLRVKCPNKAREHLENKLLPVGTIMMGFLDPLNHDTSHITHWQALGIIPVSLELLHLTADDPKNAQAAMSRFAGRLALQDALQHYQGTFSKKVTIIGTGPAGFSAAFAARDLRLPVQLLGRQERYRQAAEAAGISYYVLPKDNQKDFIRAHLRDQTIIITAARNIGEKAPQFIDETTLALLPEKAVIIDLSAGEGGSVVGSKQDHVVIVDRNISIVNVSGYPKTEPKAASEAYAECMVNLLGELITPEREIDLKSALFSQFFRL